MILPFASASALALTFAFAFLAIVPRIGNLLSASAIPAATPHLFRRSRNRLALLLKVLRPSAPVALAFALLTPAAHAQSPISGQHVLQLTAQLLQVAPKRFNGSP